MTYIDMIEMLGDGIDSGIIDRPTAADLLAELTSGGLTTLGADNLLADWRRARARYDEQWGAIMNAVSTEVEQEKPQ